MRYLIIALSITVTLTGIIATLDWDNSEVVRWCLGFLLVAVVAMFLSGCADARALYDACHDGLCR